MTGRPRAAGPVAVRELAIAVFRTAFERWIDPDNHRDFRQLVRDSLDPLKALTAA